MRGFKHKMRGFKHKMRGFRDAHVPLALVAVRLSGGPRYTDIQILRKSNSKKCVQSTQILCLKYTFRHLLEFPFLGSFLAA